MCAGHYTCHTKSVVTKAQNVLVLRDIQCAGYVAGGNTRFFGEGQAQGNPITAAQVKAAIESRLSFSDDITGEYESMLAFPVAMSFGNKRDSVITVSNKVLPWEVGSTSFDYFPGGQDAFTAAGSAAGLDSIHFGEDQRAQQANEFMSQGSVNNSLCFLGPHRVYSDYAAGNAVLVPGQGHFGPDAIPGDARWRRGEVVSLEAARSQVVAMETAAASSLVFKRGA